MSQSRNTTVVARAELNNQVRVFHLRYPRWHDRREALKLAFELWMSLDDLGLRLL